MISFILYYLSGLTLIVVIALLLISKLFHETYILKGYIRFLLKQPREIEWDSSKDAEPEKFATPEQVAELKLKQYY